MDLKKNRRKNRHDKAGCRNKSKRSQINAIYFFIKVIGRGADEVAELAVQHYGLPYTGAEYLRWNYVKIVILLVDKSRPKYYKVGIFHNSAKNPIWKKISRVIRT